MARTRRNYPLKFARQPSFLGQRKADQVAREQEVPVRRKPKSVPDDRSELVPTSWPQTRRSLARLLSACIGRPWAEVLRKARKQFKSDRLTSKLVSEHLSGHVETNPVIQDGKDGKILLCSPHNGGRPLRNGDFYVDPTGRLCRVKAADE